MSVYVVVKNLRKTSDRYWQTWSEISSIDFNAVHMFKDFYAHYESFMIAHYFISANESPNLVRASVLAFEFLLLSMMSAVVLATLAFVVLFGLLKLLPQKYRMLFLGPVFNFAFLALFILFVSLHLVHFILVGLLLLLPRNVRMLLLGPIFNMLGQINSFLETIRLWKKLRDPRTLCLFCHEKHDVRDCVITQCCGHVYGEKCLRPLLIVSLMHDILMIRFTIFNPCRTAIGAPCAR